MASNSFPFLAWNSFQLLCHCFQNACGSTRNCCWCHFRIHDRDLKRDKLNKVNAECQKRTQSSISYLSWYRKEHRCNCRNVSRYHQTVVEMAWCRMVFDPCCPLNCMEFHVRVMDKEFPPNWRKTLNLFPLYQKQISIEARLGFLTSAYSNNLRIPRIRMLLAIALEKTQVSLAAKCHSSSLLCPKASALRLVFFWWIWRDPKSKYRRKSTYYRKDCLWNQS